MRLLSKEAEKQGSRLQSPMAKNYARAMSVLENHIHQNLSVGEIARLCNMSEISLQKTFSKYAGIGVRQYYNRLKITAATQMLQAGVAVKECAKLLGFANQNYFSTVFKRITGTSPADYKREIKSQ